MTSIRQILPSCPGPDQLSAFRPTCTSGRRAATSRGNEPPLLRYLHEYKSAGGVEIDFSRLVDDVNQVQFQHRWRERCSEPRARPSGSDPAPSSESGLERGPQPLSSRSRANAEPGG